MILTGPAMPYVFGLFGWHRGQTHTNNVQQLESLVAIWTNALITLKYHAEYTGTGEGIEYMSGFQKSYYCCHRLSSSKKRGSQLYIYI